MARPTAPRYPYPPAAPAPAGRPVRGAPAAVRVVAAVHYAVAATCLGAAALAMYLAGDSQALDGSALPPRVRDNIAAVGVGSALLLTGVGFAALLIGRKVRRGRRWARALVYGLSVPSIALTLSAGIQGHARHVFAGLVLPVVFVTLLSTAPARAWFRRGPPATPPYAGPPYPGPPPPGPARPGPR